MKKLYIYLIVSLGVFSAKAEQVTDSVFHLITFLYNETDLERLKEYIECLENNIKHQLIKTIDIIYDVVRDDDTNELLSYLQDYEKKYNTQEKKIRIIYGVGRPTYDYCFNFANKYYPNSIVVVSNADIYFNGTLDELKEYDFTNKFLALTRWDVSENGELKIYMPKGQKAIFSQDAWIFKTPITLFEGSNIQLGIPHCDGRIAYHAKKAGIEVINPCYTIQACHLHLSGVRNYNALPSIKEMTTVEWSALRVLHNGFFS